MQQKTTEKTGMHTYGFIFTHETRETGGLLTAISEHVAFHTSNLQPIYTHYDGYLVKL